MKKRFSAVTVIIFLIITLLASTVIVSGETENTNIVIWDGTAAEGFESGTGTQNDPYIIATAKQLAFLATSVNEGTSYEDKYIEITKDIYLNDTTGWENWDTVAPANQWTAIGNDFGSAESEGAYFAGILNGNGKKIFGLYIKNEDEQSYSGLFGINNGSVYNVRVEQSCICSEGEVGGITGFNGGLVSDCSYFGKIAGSYAAGICCQNLGTIDNCTTYGDITGKVEVGGICAYNSKGITYSGKGDISDYTNWIYIYGTISYCNNEGNVGFVGSNTGTNTCGGICGYNAGIINYCRNFGNVSGKTFVGGISGGCDFTISECYNAGIITGSGLTGGISGYLEFEGTIENCYNCNKVIGVDSVGGICGGALDEPTINSSYNVGTVIGSSSIGGIIANRSLLNSSAIVHNCIYLTGCAKDKNGTIYYGCGLNADVAGEIIGLTESQFVFSETSDILDYDNIWYFDSSNGYVYPKLLAFSENIQWHYISNGDGTCSASLTSIRNPISNLVIPEVSPSGDIVVSIVKGTAESVKIESLEIPDSVCSFDLSAFSSDDKLTIICNHGSVAEKYALLNNYKCEYKSEEIRMDSINPTVSLTIERTKQKYSDSYYSGTVFSSSITIEDDYCLKKYDVEISTDSGKTFSIFKTVDVNEISKYVCEQSELDFGKLSDGEIVVRVSAYDLSGNKGESESCVLTVKKSPSSPVTGLTLEPTVSKLIISWDDMAQQEDFLAFIVYRSDAIDGTYETVSLQSSAIYHDKDTEYGKTYYYYVTNIDIYGNESERSAVVSGTTLNDDEPPRIESCTFDNYSLNFSGSMSMRVWTTDNNQLSLVSVELLNNTDECIEIASDAIFGNSFHDVFSFDLRNVPNGRYLVRVKVSDVAGNTTTTVEGPVKVYAYCTPSITEINKIENINIHDIYWQNASYEASLNAIKSIGISSVTGLYSQNGTDYYEFGTVDIENNPNQKSIVWDAENLEPGVYSYRLKITDKNGDSYYSTADEIKVYEYSPVVLEWGVYSSPYSIDHYEVYRKYWGTEKYTQLATLPASSNPILYFDRNVGSSEYNYYVKAVDVFGEVAESKVITINVDEDTEAPKIISSGPSNGSYCGKINLSVEASDNYRLSSAIAEYSINGNDYIRIAGEGISGNKQTFKSIWDIRKLDSGAYYLRFKISDCAGNTTYSDVTIVNVVRYSLPKITGAEISSGHYSIVLNWSNEANEKSLVKYEIYRKSNDEENFSLIDTISNTANSYSDDNIAPGNYEYYIKAIDIFGETSLSQTLTGVSKSMDTDNPTVSVTLTRQSYGIFQSNTCIVNLTADDEYSIDKYEIIVSTDDGKSYKEIYSSSILEYKSHIQTGKSLDFSEYDEGNIIIIAKVYDKDGHFGVSDIQKFFVDKTPPEPVTNISLTESQGDIFINWEKTSKESDFFSFIVYRSDSESGPFVPLDFISTIGYYDDDVTTDKTYYYYVTCIDCYFNESEKSDIVSRTLVDNEAPNIFDYSPKDGTFCGKINFRVSVTDNYLLSSAIIEYSTDGVSYSELSAKEITGKSALESFNCYIQDFNEGQYYFRFKITDSAGNIGYSETIPVKILKYTTPEITEISTNQGHFAITLNWVNAAQDESIKEYKVYRKKTGDETFTEIASLSADIHSYQDDELMLGEYEYYVQVEDILAVTAISKVVKETSKSFDTIAPTVVLSTAYSVTAPGLNVEFSIAGTMDNDKLSRYVINFGDGCILEDELNHLYLSRHVLNSGEDCIFEGELVHSYLNPGDYIVTLTVYDRSENSNTTSLIVKVINPETETEYEIVRINTIDEEDDSFLPDTNIIIMDGETGEIIIDEKIGDRITSSSISNGEFVIVLKKGMYLVSAKNGDKCTLNKDVRIDPTDDPEDEENHKKEKNVQLILKREKYLKGSITTREMTAEEIISAGIDTNNPDNRFVIECHATFTYTEVKQGNSFSFTYRKNASGKILSIEDELLPESKNNYWVHYECGGVTGMITHLDNNNDDNKEYFLVISGETSFTKQMFRVDLLLLNTSENDWVEDCTATINLPDGLSLALMLGDAQNATVAINDGKIDKQGQGQATWYIKGDNPGTYYISATVNGTYYPEPAEPFSKTFVTEDPITIRDASKALNMTISGVPEYVTRGDIKELSFDVTNITSSSLYFVKLSFDGVESETFEELKAGETVSVKKQYTFNFGGGKDVIAYKLKSAVLICSTNVPTEIKYVGNYKISVNIDSSGVSEDSIVLELFKDETLIQTVNDVNSSYVFSDITPGNYALKCTSLKCGTQEFEMAIVDADAVVNITVPLYGDVNGDGTVNGQDVVRLKKYLANYNYSTNTSTVEIKPGADANGDGKINGQDVVRLKKYLANYNYSTRTSSVVLGPSK